MKYIEFKEYLEENHIGEYNAITSSKLQELFGVKGVRIREIINLLRINGEPICSGQTGYFYASTPSEIRATINNLEARIDSIGSARKGMMRSEMMREEINIGNKADTELQTMIRYLREDEWILLEMEKTGCTRQEAEDNLIAIKAARTTSL